MIQSIYSTFPGGKSTSSIPAEVKSDPQPLISQNKESSKKTKFPRSQNNFAHSKKKRKYTITSFTLDRNQ